ncbi:MAG: branched-chain amino acid ABC transporter ATP-binding protein/permease [Alphaproteobacteria bacterium]|nr:branched-chain amino acid ABC transporter ATP-binding protein/permease [Alphaproteobacteria bacterium]
MTATPIDAAKPPAVSWRTRLRNQLNRPINIAIIAAAAFAFPLVDRNDGDVDAAANALAFAILALGLNIVVGFAGLLDLGYAAFFAIGAYTYGIFASYQVQPEWSAFWEPLQWLGLVARLPGVDGGVDHVHFTVSFWLMLPVSALVAAFFGMLFGAPTLRLKGDYLAIVTLGFGEIVPIVARNMPSLTNGAAGLNGVAPPNLFGFTFGVKSMPYYYLGLTLLVVLIFVSVRLRDSRVGRAWMAIREDEIAAEAMGINRARLKLLAFAVGAAFAGMTGTFYVAKLQTATPEMFTFPVSVMVLVMIVLGGMGSVAGVVLGALILQLLQSWFLQDLTQWIHALGRVTGVGFLEQVDLVQSIELIFGVVLVVMMLYRREGLIPAQRAVTHLTHAEQTAVPSRGGIAGEFALTRRAIDKAKPLLEVKGLRKSYGGIKAVQGIDLTVMPGSIVAVIGPNGSGKTTLFNLITGLVKPDGGRVLLGGEEITALAPHLIVERGIARTFQNLRLFANMTVTDNVLVGTHARTATGLIGAVLRSPRVRREEHDARKRAVGVLSIFGNRLLPRIEHLARTLSYANRRRLEIARALVSEPALLLLDEPTAGMNPTETLELTDQIRSLRERGLTILLIEHKLNVVNEIADTVVVLDHGEKIAEGSPEEVHRNKEVLRAYLGRTTNAAA